MSSVQLEDLADRIRPRAASNILLWVIVAFVFAFLIWAGLAQVSRTVRGQGRVIPTSQLQVVSNLEGGVVAQILVRTGQQVAAGTPLVRLDPTATGSDLGSGEATVQAMQMRIARLTAELAARDPVYPSTADPSALAQMEVERALHAARMAELASLIGANRARLSAAEHAVAEADAAYQSRLIARDERAHEVEMLRPLVERGIEPRLALVQAEGAAAVARSDAAQSAAAAARARAGVVEARSSLAQAGQDWRSRAATELTTTQADMASRSAMLPALAARLQRTVLRAPVAGRVNRVLVTTPGGTVQPHQPLVEIVPSEDNLLIEAQIKPQDIGSVHIGQMATVGITAYDRAIYGALEGRVISISPDATVVERTGESFYSVRVRTTGNALRDAQGHALPIGAGMVAEVDLLGDDRSILSYILTPITRLRESAFRE